MAIFWRFSRDRRKMVQVGGSFESGTAGYSGDKMTKLGHDILPEYLNNTAGLQ